MSLASPIAALKGTLDRVLGDAAEGNDIAEVKAAFACGKLILVNGNRSVAGQDFTDAIITRNSG